VPSVELLVDYGEVEYWLHSHFVFSSTPDGGAYERDMDRDHNRDPKYEREKFSPAEIQGVLQGVVGLMSV
jgi:hypothetical protein